MLWTKQIGASLDARRNQIGKVAFHCLTRRLSPEARQVLFRILGGDSLEEIEEAIARSHWLAARAQGPTEMDLAAAAAELQYLLNEIEARFQLASGEDRSDSQGGTMRSASVRS